MKWDSLRRTGFRPGLFFILLSLAAAAILGACGLTGGGGPLPTVFALPTPRPTPTPTPTPEPTGHAYPQAPPYSDSHAQRIRQRGTAAGLPGRRCLRRPGICHPGGPGPGGGDHNRPRGGALGGRGDQQRREPVFWPVAGLRRHGTGCHAGRGSLRNRLSRREVLRARL